MGVNWDRDWDGRGPSPHMLDVDDPLHELGDLGSVGQAVDRATTFRDVNWLSGLIHDYPLGVQCNAVTA